ncbi:hypothetical protein [Marinomonas ostreistagni]|uniref:Chromosome partition protein Smc n=1 Tax=Marinomonas ostreistagni TaxID=359209 RepID=A0ABS0ZE42_9GAMM|nr:hypothetical protein [Marinomonas ostreistagni]MBJ7551942.1 hypothetical protein [Marinomonas ostreistagni]
MRKPYRYVVPVALGVALSACSTTQTSEKDSSTLIHSSMSASDTSDQAFASNSNSSKLDDAKLLEQERVIRDLRKQLAQNSEKLVILTAQLDEKDRLLANLMSTDEDASQLIEIERLQNEREVLERKYNQLRLENDRLTQRVADLESQAQKTELQLVQHQSDFIELNKNFRTLDSAHYSLSKDYRDLSIKHAHLKSELESLVSENGRLLSEFNAIKQENLTLGGALSEARAQHQVLWDKIRVQSNVIDTLQAENANLNRNGSIISASENSDGSNTVDTAQLESQISRLKAELNAQNSLISNYQNDVQKLEQALVRQEDDLGNQLSSVEMKYREAVAENAALNREIKTVQEMLEVSEKNAQQLQQTLQNTSAEKDAVLAQLSELKQRYAASSERVQQLENQSQQQQEEKARLENQVNNLIPFEGAVLSLQQQLKSELSDVRWTLPTSANLHDTFEIQLSATVDQPVQGQTYFAELFTDSALSMMSSSEAEATVNQGKLNFRWRLSGLNERPNATMNVSVTQAVNYDGQMILRKVYRDAQSVELISNDWLGKYGFWLAAILGGLLIGFVGGKVGKRS